MATLIPVQGSRNGLIISSGLTAASSGGDQFANTEREQLIVKNADASSKDVTFVSQQTVDGQAVADKTVTVAAGDTMAFGPFPAGTFNDAGGNLQVTYSAVTSVTVKVIKIAL
jgi:hypothetical protein